MAIATATALAAAAALASAGVGAYQQKKMANQQDKIAADNIRTQGRTQQQANAKINQTVDETAKSRSEPARATAQAQYLDTLTKQLGQAKAGLATRGLGEQYSELAGGAGKDIAGYGDNIAGLFARMDAPLEQRRQEGNRRGNLGMDLDVLGGNVRGDDFLSRLRQSQVRPNAGLSLLQGALKGASMLAPAGAASSAGGWLGANTPAMSGLTGADDWLKSVLSTTGRGF